MNNLKEISKTELKEILKKHQMWLDGAEGGARAILEGVNLFRANLWGANLEEANLEGANLEEANLEEANLTGANLFRASLWGVNLEGANLEEANLEGTYLTRANLSGANLKWANLSEANLSEANLEGAILEGANLFRASLWNTTGNGKEIKTLLTEMYTINYTTDKIIQIGCENHTSEEWFSFSGYEISQMDDGALEFWNEWKPKLKALLT